MSVAAGGMDDLARSVLGALSHDDALTVAEVAERACDRQAWRHRTNVRNRLYALERDGWAICDDERPQRWMLNEYEEARP